MEILESLGVELIPFSPIHDQELPAKVSGVILGGGYPENYAKALSENTSMLASIRQAWENKMPFSGRWWIFISAPGIRRQ